MMQAAVPGHGYDTATSIGIHHSFPARQSFVRQQEMRPVVVIVADVFVHQAFQMPFIKNDHVVEQIAAAVADPPLGNTVLPRTAEAGFRFGWMQKLFTVSITSSLNCVPRSKIR
jgi:hypothetical protein